LPMGYLLLEPFYGNWQPIETGYGFRVQEGDSLLFSSEVDLSTFANPVLHFFSIRDNSVASALVQVSVNGGTDWQFLALVGNQDTVIDLSLYRGQIVRFQFAWLPQAETSETWQVQDVRVEEDMIPTASPTPTWEFATETVTPNVIIDYFPTLTPSPSVEVTLEASMTATETALPSASPTGVLVTATESPTPTAAEEASGLVPTPSETVQSP
jgi:hypothetical protein